MPDSQAGWSRRREAAWERVFAKPPNKGVAEYEAKRARERTWYANRDTEPPDP